MTTLSRDAQMIARTFFGFGNKASFSCGPVHKLTERARLALGELEKAGMITPMKKGELRVGAVGWKGTDKLGFPMKDYASVKLDEPMEVFVQ